MGPWELPEAAVIPGKHSYQWPIIRPRTSQGTQMPLLRKQPHGVLGLGQILQELFHLAVLYTQQPPPRH